MNLKHGMQQVGRLAIAVGVIGAASMTSAYAATAAEAEALAQDNWREAIARTPVPAEGGCFAAEYPSNTWSHVECTIAPDRAYLPHKAARTGTTGDGNDYAATTSALTTSAVGTFPTVTGVRTERDGATNVYSIQLNSNFMTGTQVCSGRSGCMSWEQFVYSSSEQSAFMQYWLINYGTCPSGWHTSGKDCWKNSAAVSVPKEPITTLASLKMSGSVSGSTDTLVFTTPTKAYSTTGADSVTNLGTAWKQSEFNIIGDGGGSSATFNKGSSITVKVAVTSGSTAAPTCSAKAGTTGETNNLTLGSCTAAGGSAPYIQFTESN